MQEITRLHTDIVEQSCNPAFLHTVRNLFLQKAKFILTSHKLGCFESFASTAAVFQFVRHNGSFMMYSPMCIYISVSCAPTLHLF